MILQRDELRLQREELRQSRAVAEEQAEAQHAQAAALSAHTKQLKEQNKQLRIEHETTTRRNDYEFLNGLAAQALELERMQKKSQPLMVVAMAYAVRRAEDDNVLGLELVAYLDASLPWKDPDELERALEGAVVDLAPLFIDVDMDEERSWLDAALSLLRNGDKP